MRQAVSVYYQVLSAGFSVLVSLLFDLLVSVDDALTAFSLVVGGLPDLPA